ncbi:MAG: hypothetical protein QOD32_2434, partial [Pyrinomonadaceae bacterium]|nr:hypothetical protein [Pyrinomonadaceae bacterium]
NVGFLIFNSTLKRLLEATGATCDTGTRAAS